MPREPRELEHCPVSPAAPERIVAVPSRVSNPNHDDCKCYAEPYNLLGNAVAFDSEGQADQFNRDEVDSDGIPVHAILENKNGDLFPMHDPWKPHEKAFGVDRAEAESFQIAESTRQIDELGRKTTVAQDNP